MNEEKTELQSKAAMAGIYTDHNGSMHYFLKYQMAYIFLLEERLEKLEERLAKLEKDAELTNRLNQMPPSQFDTLNR